MLATVNWLALHAVVNKHRFCPFFFLTFVNKRITVISDIFMCVLSGQPSVFLQKSSLYLKFTGFTVTPGSWLRRASPKQKVKKLTLYNVTDLVESVTTTWSSSRSCSMPRIPKWEEIWLWTSPNNVYPSYKAAMLTRGERLTYDIARIDRRHPEMILVWPFVCVCVCVCLLWYVALIFQMKTVRKCRMSLLVCRCILLKSKYLPVN